MSELRSEELIIITYYDSVNKRTVAYFLWQSDVSKSETYTIDVSPTVSLVLDRHFPVRPKSITVWDNDDRQSAEELSALFGQGFVKDLFSTTDLEISMGSYSLSTENRFAIAEMQTKSPSTPAILKEVCRNMIDMHTDQINESQLLNRLNQVPDERVVTEEASLTVAPHQSLDQLIPLDF